MWLSDTQSKSSPSPPPGCGTSWCTPNTPGSPTQITSSSSSFTSGWLWHLPRSLTRFNLMCRNWGTFLYWRYVLPLPHSNRGVSTSHHSCRLTIFTLPFGKKGGFFLVGGIMLFFDRAMYVDLSLSRARAMALRATWHCCFVIFYSHAKLYNWLSSLRVSSTGWPWEMWVRPWVPLTLMFVSESSLTLQLLGR